MERKNINLLRCREDDVSYIMGLQNFMHEEVQEFCCVKTERDKKIYLFSLGEKSIKKMLSSDKNIFIIAVSENNIIGFICAWGIWQEETDVSRKKLLIQDMSVLKEYRRLGVGTSLVETLKKYSIENGYEKLFAATSRDDIPAINLAMKTGAERINRPPLTAIFFENEDIKIDIERDENYQNYPASFRWRVSL